MNGRAPSLRGTVRSAIHVSLTSTAVGVLIVLQDAVNAAHFAASSAADAYQLAISVPTLALNVFAGGTLLATMVPRLVQLENAGRGREAEAMVRHVRRAMSWFLLGICLVWGVTYPLIAASIAGDISAATLSLSTRLTWIYLPVLWLSGLASVEAAALNSRNRFEAQSWMPAFVPAGTVIFVFLLADRLGIMAAALGAVGGGIVLLLSARRSTASLFPRDITVDPIAPAVGSAWVVYGVSALSAALLGGVLISDTWMASTLTTGSAATFGYATRPIILLLAFATTVVGNVLLPTFSRLAADGDWQRLRRQFLAWCALLALCTLPVVLLVSTWAEDLAAIAYQRGSFTAADTQNVAAVLRVYVIHVPFFLVGMVGWRLLSSLERYRVLLVVAAIAFVTNLVVAWALIPSLGLAGIAWGADAAFVAWAVSIGVYLVAVGAKTGASAGSL